MPKLAGLAFLLCVARARVPVLGDGAATSSEAPRFRALLVGCSEYPYLREELGAEVYERELRLRGPENDVELVRRTLERVFGLAGADTVVLTGWGEDPASRPTRANVLAALDRLANEAEDGERVVVYLAGHGSQERGQEAGHEGEPDGLDEVFLAADARTAEEERGSIPGSIRDDELGAHARAIRDAGAEVWLIVDACHSGTMLRGGLAAESGDVRLRGIDPAQLGVTAGLRGERTTGALQNGWIGDDTSERIAALYAAQSYGRAPEMPAPRGAAEVHGLFTYVLCQELERGARGTYQELLGRVIAAYQAFPCAITVPGGEGDLERDIRSGASAGPALLCTMRSGVPWLDGGRLAGVEPGLVARVSDLAHGELSPLARVEVVESDLFEARARILEGELPSGRALPVEIESRKNEDWRLALSLVRPDGTEVDPRDAPPSVRGFLERARERFPLVRSDAAEWVIVLPDSGEPWLRPGAGAGGFDVFRLRPDLATVLERIQGTEILRRFSAGALTCPWNGELELEIFQRRSAGDRPRRLESGDLLHPGDEIKITLEKRSEHIFDVNVLYLDASFGRKLLFPRADGSPRFAAEARAAQTLTPGPDGWIPVVDDALGPEHVLVFATPRTPASPEVRLSFLAQDAVQRGAAARSDPFASMLERVAGGRDLRGESLGAGADVMGTQSLLVTVHTAWGELGPPDWSAEETFEVGSVRSPGSGAGPPDPWECGTRGALTSSAAAGGKPDLLLLGGERVRAVLIDFDGDSEGTPAEQVGERRFDAEAAFVFAEDGRYALYEEARTPGFALVLVDRDGDGIAEERRERAGGTWIVREAVALPWLSQAYLPRGLGGTSEERSARFSVLQRNPPPGHGRR